MNPVRFRAAAALVCALAVSPLSAADLRVLSAGAAKEAVLPLAQAFANASGHNVDIDFGTMGLIQDKLRQGERADVLVLAAEVADTLARAGTIVPGSVRPLAKVGIGVAVGATARAPDISTAAAFRQALVDARSIVMIDPARGTSGKHLVEVYQRLGLTELLKPKMRYGAGGYIVEPVGRGEVELGLHQISEILPVKGVRLVGPLPEELQKWTVYVGAITPSTASAQAARELIAYLSGFQSKATYLSKGFLLVE
ncbi:MAG: substrate-binding domain-containing protein [Burkholderiales bacterium]|nr:substrate-binding domain-containing protein [Burkholderiales bacterium]